MLDKESFNNKQLHHWSELDKKSYLTRYRSVDNSFYPTRYSGVNNAILFLPME